MITKQQNCKLCGDNWFSSVPLMIYLTNQGILPLGTVRVNPIHHLAIRKGNEDKGNVDISVVSWYHHKIATHWRKRDIIQAQK